MSKQREALKMALKALERGRPQIVGVLVQQDQDEAIKAVRETLAEPEQEPVAWMMVNEKHGHKPTLHWKPQEDWHITWKAVPLYAAPPARKPLTDEEIDAEFDRECWVTVVFADGTKGIALDRVTARDFARAIERAHGIDGGHDCWR